MNILIVGLGQVGRAHAELLSKKFKVYTKDLGQLEKFGEEGEERGLEFYDLMCIALDYHGIGHDRFMEISRGYIEQYKPRLINVLSTVSPGTTALLRPDASHSTTRGLHPNLVSGLRTIAKHVGGPTAPAIARYFEAVGIRCITHKKAATTELAHLLNNSAYGVSLMFADEAARLCREYGVDYYEAVMRYTATHNQGFKALDHERQCRPILTPPNGHVGGHCVTQGATLIPKDKRGWLLEKLADYNVTRCDAFTKSVWDAVTGKAELASCEDDGEGNGTERTAS